MFFGKKTTYQSLAYLGARFRNRSRKNKKVYWHNNARSMRRIYSKIACHRYSCLSSVFRRVSLKNQILFCFSPKFLCLITAACFLNTQSIYNSISVFIIIKLRKIKNFDKLVSYSSSLSQMKSLQVFFSFLWIETQHVSSSRPKFFAFILVFCA